MTERKDDESKADWRGRAMFEQSNWLTWVMEQEGNDENTDSGGINTELGLSDSEFSVAELADWSPSDIVSADGTTGVILEKYTSAFTPPDGDSEKDASEDSPKYEVALGSGGFDVFSASEIESDTIEVEGDAGPSDVADAELSEGYQDIEESDNIAELDASLGWSSYPDSWEESETPSRLILLDMWSSVGASFSGCVTHFSDDVGRVNAFCGSTKDEIYQTTSWR